MSEFDSRDRRNVSHLQYGVRWPHQGAPVRVAPSPPAAPELPEGWHTSAQRCWYENADTVAVFTGAHQLRVQYESCVSTIPLAMLRVLLATQGLTIVDAKDRAVLEATDIFDELNLTAFERLGAGQFAAAVRARREKP
jgi:hypothetical protein